MAGQGAAGEKFTVPFPRLNVREPIPLFRNEFNQAAFPADLNERPAKRLSYHTDFSNNPNDPDFINPVTGHWERTRG